MQDEARDPTCNPRGLCLCTCTMKENWTPAHMACIYGNVGLLEVLIKSGALFEAQTKVMSVSRPLFYHALLGTYIVAAMCADLH